MKKSEWFTVFELSLPVLLGYIPLGMGFGFLFVEQGGNPWLGIVMSILVYAGAAQYMVIAMLMVQAPLWSIALATFVMNLRHIFYGLSLLDQQQRSLAKRVYAIFALTDETYSLLTATKNMTEEQRFLLIMFNHCWWILGSILGVLLGQFLTVKTSGIEFTLTALFVVLCMEQAYSCKKTAPFWVALVCFVLAGFIWPAQSLMLSIALVMLSSFWFYRQTTSTV